MHQPSVTALTAAVDACAALDLTAVPSAALAAMVVDLRAAATRLEAAIAKVVHAADQAEVWKTTGAASMDVWLAETTNATVRSARDQVQLANTLAAAPLVADKMRDGDLSVDNVRLLASVVHHDAFADYATDLVNVAAGHRDVPSASSNAGWPPSMRTARSNATKP